MEAHTPNPRDSRSPIRYNPRPLSPVVPLTHQTGCERSRRGKKHKTHRNTHTLGTKAKQRQFDSHRSGYQNRLVLLSYVQERSKSHPQSEVKNMYDGVSTIVRGRLSSSIRNHRYHTDVPTTTTPGKTEARLGVAERT